MSFLPPRPSNNQLSMTKEERDADYDRYSKEIGVWRENRNKIITRAWIVLVIYLIADTVLGPIIDCKVEHRAVECRIK